MRTPVTAPITAPAAAPVTAVLSTDLPKYSGDGAAIGSVIFLLLLACGIFVSFRARRRKR